LSHSGSRHRVWAALIGLAVTVAVLLAYQAALTERLELQALDSCFRHFGRVQADPRIVHIDITDASLEALDWPWPRRLHAELIDLLTELGARSAVFDIVFADPSAPRLELPQLSADYDLEPDLAVRGEVTAEDAIYDDDELAGAIARAGNVYLPLFFRLDSPGLTSLDEQIVGLLQDDFTLTLEQLADRLGRPTHNIDRVLAGLKRRVAAQRVGQILHDRPSATAEYVSQQIQGDAPSLSAPDRKDLLWAYRREKALRMLQGESSATFAEDASLPEAHDLTPPLPKLLADARGFGYVIFEPDRDGVVRRLPLFARFRGTVLKQLALAVACDILGVPDEGVSLEANGRLLKLEAPDRGLVAEVPLDRRGELLINWAGGSAADWTHVFTHVPITRILEIYDARRAIAENHTRLLLDLADMVRIFTPAAYADYELLARRRSEMQRQNSEPKDAAREDAPSSEALAALNQQIKGLEDSARYVLSEYYTAAGQQEPSDQQERVLFEAARRLYPRLIEGRLSGQIEAANARLDERIRRRTAELRPLISQKICLIGYTASATADIRPTPLFQKTPGVMVHSNVLNSLLQKRFVTPAGPLANGLMIVVCGLLATAFTTGRGPRLSLLLVLLMIGLVWIVHAQILFAHYQIWIAVVSPILAVFLSWSLITMYRQLTEERTKRQIAAALAQYTAPAIAQEIVQDPAHCDLSPVQREVTAFFSDLRGFTSIAERLGPEQTRSLLGPYLARMSEVLHRHSALINKFYGDGIFAFFNPPLLVVAQHAQQACVAAVDSLASLEQLKREHQDDPLADQFEELYMRIGIATGPVYVGDFGSVNKLDYTCLGDAVNLAARLESANKVFGTQILIAESTKKLLDDDFALRYLADLQVKGKTETVPVFELLGPSDKVNADTRAYADSFADGVELFKQARWSDCIAHFERLGKARPDDAAAEYYIQTCRQFQQSGPPDDWRGQLQLQEK